MKNLSVKNILKNIISLCIFVFMTSCSSDEGEPTVVFNSFTANKIYSFVEDKITLTVQGTGYTDVSLKTSNDKIKITQITKTLFEISTTEATNAIVYAELKNNSYSEVKNVTLNFYEHGVVDFKTVEAIRVNNDTSYKLLELLGEPLLKTISSNSIGEFWSYPSRGVSFYVIKSSKLVESASVYSSNFFLTLEDNTKVFYTNYPYELGSGWKINTPETTMDLVVEKFGIPSQKINSSDPASTYRLYTYPTGSVNFGFYGNTEDDYKGKTIRFLAIF